MNNKNKYIGADIVVKTLENINVEKIFGIPGIHNLDIYDSLISSKIEHITAKHEQGAGFMADGYARTNDKPGVCLVISGPGLTNIITPMGEAMADSVPMVVISSQLPTSVLDQGTGFLHELKNSTYLAESVAKQSKRISHKDQIIPSIEEAYQLAMAGNPGPVHVEIPLDILQAGIKNLDGKFDNSKKISCNPWEDIEQDDKINEVVNSLKKADDSIIIAGGGSTHASDELKELIEKLNIPVVQTIAGKGVISEKNSLSLGTSLIYKKVREKINKVDCVLALGTDLAPTDFENFKLNIKGKLIQVDIDPGNFQKNYTADLKIKGDTKKVLNQINEKITSIDDNSQVNNPIKFSKQDLLDLRGMKKDKLDFTLDILEGIRNAMPEDGILTADMTAPAYIARTEYPAYQPNTFLHPVGYGTLGYALPAAIGAKFVNKDRSVVALLGDGGFQFTMQELGVLLNYEMSLPIIIWNNEGYEEIRKNELQRHPGQKIAVDHKNPDLQKLAASYEMSYSMIRDPQNIKSTIKKAFKKNKPEIIEVIPEEC